MKPQRRQPDCCLPPRRRQKWASDKRGPEDTANRYLSQAKASYYDKKGQPRRGRPRKYGSQRIDLAKRAGQSRGWQIGSFTLYGREVIKRYKTFLATYQPAGGVIRVVLVKNEDASWVPYFCTDSRASVAEVLEAVADRSAVEQVFHDVKQIHGAGQPQLSNVWANVAARQVALWLYTLPWSSCGPGAVRLRR